jgi:hypothetical protein
MGVPSEKVEAGLWRIYADLDWIADQEADEERAASIRQVREDIYRLLDGEEID